MHLLGFTSDDRIAKIKANDMNHPEWMVIHLMVCPIIGVYSPLPLRPRLPVLLTF